MIKAIGLYLYFNFRSSYFYLACSRMFEVFDQHHLNIIWRLLGALVRFVANSSSKNHGADTGGCRPPLAENGGLFRPW